VTALEAVTVLEVGVTRASAFAGRLLRLAGATVTRVALRDAPSLPPAARLYLDPGKVEIAERPAEAWDALLESSDVLITDLSDKELARLGLLPGQVRAAHPGLVLALLSPTRERRWPASRTCGELSMQAESGFMHMTGSPDREPLGVPYHLGCLSLGMHAAAAATAALLRRDATGEGALVELVGADILASYLRIYGAVSEYYEIPLKRDGRRAPGSGGRYPFGIFPCADGYVALIGRTGRDWDNILAMMGHPAWAQQPRYQDLHGMAMDYPDEVDRLVDPWFRQHTRGQLLELAQKLGIPMAPVRRIDEITADPQFQYREFFDAFEQDGTRYVVPGMAWRT
jgi:CoA:oxalate CoA-transferase